MRKLCISQLGGFFTDYFAKLDLGGGGGILMALPS